MGPTRVNCHGNEIWARRGDPVAYRLVKIFSGMITKYAVIGSPTCGTASVVGHQVMVLW